MPLDSKDIKIRQSVAIVVARVTGRQPSPDELTIIIEAYNKRPSYESSFQRIVEAIKATRIPIAEWQVKTANTGDIDRLIDEIEKDQKQKPK